MKTFKENTKQTTDNRAKQFAFDIERQNLLPQHKRKAGKQMKFKMEFLQMHGKKYL